MRLNQRGVTLLGAMLAGALVITVGLFALRSLTDQKGTQSEARAAARAGFYVSELLEMFRSLQTTQRVMDYLTQANNPQPPYQMCAHLNLLDRATNGFVNRDPAADLPPNALGFAGNGVLGVNRTYRVHIVDGLTLAPDFAFCGPNAGAGPPLGPQHRAVVTVTVSWVNPGDPAAAVRTVSASTMMPR